MYKIEKFVLGPWQANCYVLCSGKEMLVLDPGAEADRVISCLQKLQDKYQAKVTALVSTHGHSDHIGAVNEVREYFQVPFMLHEADVPMAATPELSGFADEGSKYAVKTVERCLKEGDVIKWGEDSLEIFHLPGHTPGSICLVDQVNRKMFSGDVLFYNSIGRTDFVLGNAQDMRKSCQRLRSFASDLEVFPGHGQGTRMDRELRLNPYLQNLSPSSR